jgi:hypothetical protein
MLSAAKHLALFDCSSINSPNPNPSSSSHTWINRPPDVMREPWKSTLREALKESATLENLEDRTTAEASYSSLDWGIAIMESHSNQSIRKHMPFTRRELCSALAAMVAGILPVRGVSENAPALSLSSGPLEKVESMMTANETIAGPVGAEQESYLGSLALADASRSRSLVSPKAKAFANSARFAKERPKTSGQVFAAGAAGIVSSSQRVAAGGPDSPRLTL